MSDERRPGPAGLVLDVAVVTGCVLALGVLVGVVWPQLADPVLSERTAQGISTNEVQLGKVFSSDGWFTVLGFGGSLLLGAGLMLRRRSREAVVLLLLLVGTYVAARYVAQPLGLSLGPSDPVKVLTDAKVGATAPQQLDISSRADRLAWPLGAAIGALVVLLGANRLERDRVRRDDAASSGLLRADGLPPQASADDRTPSTSGD